MVIRGDQEVNEIKVKNYLGAAELELADDDMILKATGAPRGFAGAVGIKTRLIADYSVMNLVNIVTGANREDYHLKNANIGRDFEIESYADLRVAEPGDACPRCAGSVKFVRGIEVGHVFKLGTKYSKAMKAVYLDRDGKEKTMMMGCYGIGIGRTVAACIEQNFDQNGIIWPMPLAPYSVIVTPVNINDADVMKASEEIYAQLLACGVEVILDDRDERAGVKFKDADLIGIPLRIVVGPKNLAKGQVELKIRRSGESRLYATPDVVSEVQGIIAAELKEAS